MPAGDFEMREIAGTSLPRARKRDCCRPQSSHRLAIDAVSGRRRTLAERCMFHHETTSADRFTHLPRLHGSSPLRELIGLFHLYGRKIVGKAPRDIRLLQYRLDAYFARSDIRPSVYGDPTLFHGLNRLCLLLQQLCEIVLAELNMNVRLVQKPSRDRLARFPANGDQWYRRIVEVGPSEAVRRFSGKPTLQLRHSLPDCGGPLRLIDRDAFELSNNLRHLFIDDFSVRLWHPANRG